jgi:hypothetical protein
MTDDDEDIDLNDDEDGEGYGDDESDAESGDERENDDAEFNPWGDDEEPVVAIYGELTPVPYSCAACGEHNETQFDLSGGYHQQYTEDCTVCCRPNLLTLNVDDTTHVVTIENELEYE